MGRMTRAKAAAVAEQMHIDEDALLELNRSTDELIPALSQPEHRGPLCELSPNRADCKGTEETYTAERTATVEQKMDIKGTEQSTSVDPPSASFASATGDGIPAVIANEHQAARSLANRAASNHLANDGPEFEKASQMPVDDTRPMTPVSHAVKHASSQLGGPRPAVQPVVPNFDSDQSEVTQTVDQESDQNETLRQHTLQTTSDIDASHNPFVDSVGSDTATIVSHEVPPTSEPGSSSPHLETDRDLSMDMSNVENVGPNNKYDQLEQAVVDASTPPRSKSKAPRIPASKPTYDQLEPAALNASHSGGSPTSTTMSGNAIEALDAEDDAVEKVTAGVLNVQDSPQKPKSKKEAPVVRTTKASQARISLAHGLPGAPPKAPAMGRPRQSMAQLTEKRITSSSSTKTTASAKDDSSLPEKKEVVIPHSKPRPMSMQFKPPPPLAKSAKAPTQITFQLPGEAVAAKLKAAKEARQQKDAEDQKKRTFKARPAPSMTKAPAVRQTSTSKARESLMTGSVKPLGPSIGSTRPMSVASSRPATGGRPSTSFAKPTGHVRSASMLKANTARRASGAESKPTKRASTDVSVSTNDDRRRASLAPKPNPPVSPTASRAPAFQAGRGKEVFQRSAHAKNQAEQQKREKEEAAKKARAEAAERSRALCREWAAKQKAKKAAGAKTASVDENVVDGDEANGWEVGGVVESIESA